MYIAFGRIDGDTKLCVSIDSVENPISSVQCDVVVVFRKDRKNRNNRTETPKYAGGYFIFWEKFLFH